MNIIDDDIETQKTILGEDLPSKFKNMMQIADLKNTLTKNWTEE